MSLRQAAEMALKYFEDAHGLEDAEVEIKEALRQALYVDKVYMSEKHVHKSDKSIHEREWVGLTRRELDIATLGLEDLGDCYVAIEAKLKEKNNG